MKARRLLNAVIDTLCNVWSMSVYSSFVVVWAAYAVFAVTIVGVTLYAIYCVFADMIKHFHLLGTSL